MREPIVGVSGLVLVGVLTSAFALRSSTPPPSTPAAVVSQARPIAKIPDADAIVGRPFDGARMEGVLRTWSRHVARRGLPPVASLRPKRRGY